VPRYLFSAVFACIAAACGSEERGITQPSPQSGPLAVVLVQNTLNAPDNRASRSLMHSYLRPYQSASHSRTLERMTISRVR